MLSQFCSTFFFNLLFISIFLLSSFIIFAILQVLNKIVSLDWGKQGWVLILHCCPPLRDAALGLWRGWLDSHGTESSCLSFRALDKTVFLPCRESVMTVGPFGPASHLQVQVHTLPPPDLSLSSSLLSLSLSAALLQLTSSALYTCWTSPFHLSIMAPAPSLGMHGCICCQRKDREKREREMVRRRAIAGSIGQIAYDIVTADRGQTQQAQNQAISSVVALWAWTSGAGFSATVPKSRNLSLFVLCVNLMQLRCQYGINQQLVFDLCWIILWLCKILHVWFT